jgi:hypothetical protein
VSTIAILGGLVTLLVQMVRDDREKTRRVVLSPVVHERRMRFRGRFWPAVLVLSVSFVPAFPWIGPPNGNGAPKTSPMRFLAIWAAASVAGALYVRRHYRRKELDGPGKPAAPASGPVSNPIRTRTWVAILFVTGLAVYVLAPEERARPAGRPRARRPALAGWICLGSIGIVVAYVAAVIGIRWLRYRDPVLDRINRRAREGDVDGAIAELHHEILDRGPTANRINALVVLLVQNKDHPAAAEWARKGLALAPDRVDLRSNFALALLESGQASEAEAIYAEMIARNATQPVYFLNHASALVALGRLDEAESQLRLAEQKLDSTYYLTTQDVKGPFREAIATVRAKIVEARGAKDPTGLFPDL